MPMPIGMAGLYSKGIVPQICAVPHTRQVTKSLCVHRTQRPRPSLLMPQHPDSIIVSLAGEKGAVTDDSIPA
jgi:hypothetical protein